MKTIPYCIAFIFYLFTINIHAQDAIQITKIGSGKAILLLPGFANSSEVWKETIENINSDYEYHLVDYAGFNGLKPIETPWLPKVNSALVNYVKSNDLQELTIVGHSLGGTLALYLAAELKSHVKKIIIVDALANTAKLMFPNQASGSFSYDNPYTKSQLVMSNQEVDQMITQQITMMCKTSSKHDILKKWMINTDRETFVYGYIDYLNFNATPYLKHIDCPVNIIAATTYGIEQTKEVYKTQYHELQKYNLLFAENAAHYIMYDQPEWFYKQINKILNNG